MPHPAKVAARARRLVIVAGVTAATVTLHWGCRPRASAPPPAVAASPDPAAPVSFNEQIQPILSENCYLCHGADAGSRKGDLRLDREEHAFAPRKDGPVIVRGAPERSPLIQRIRSADPEMMMPPPDSHRTLKPEQIQLLTEWVKAGAPYEEHWAFVAPRRTDPPAGHRREWARNPVDQFVLARLEKEGLAPSPPAEAAGLLRRVTYDLTGLPPTPEEVSAFVADAAPEAYERAVDRLLASPRYGEHRARYWLDYARYADTHGLHFDNFRSIWPYRDYVIRAFNANKPFDQFTREQLAGDLLPARNLDQQLASAYVRAGISSGEGGTIIEELQVNNQRERVEAFGAVFLGLTTQCAACHDHKFDPISQKDHYQLTAFFNNLTENPSNDDRADWPPYIRLPADGDRARYDAALARRADVVAALEARRTQAPAMVAEWIASGEAPARAIAPEALHVRLKFDEQQGHTFANSAPQPAFASVVATGGTPFWGEDTWFWPSLRMETSTRLELPPGVGDIEHTDAFSVGTWIMPRLETAASSSPPFGTIAGRMDTTADFRGWEVSYDGGRATFRIQSSRLLGGVAVTTDDVVLQRGRWNHVLVVYDGSARAAGVKVYVDGQRRNVCTLSDSLTGSVRTAVPLQLGAAHPDATPLRQSRYQDFRYYGRALTDDEAGRLAYEDHVAAIVARPRREWNEDEAFAVSQFYLEHRDADSRRLRAQLPSLDATITQLTADGAIALVSAELPRPAYANVLARGAYSARQERVRPDVPHFLPPLPADAPRDRRSLADWTLRPDNPLTARVTVNRVWAELFGTGIVETTEDFGIVGARPTHPALLDWLAVEFRESGWDLKRLYRLLVTSATYRQSSAFTPALLERDPKNRLLARGPRFRLDAEMLRDTALAVSGLLVEREGGPSVKPYQPPGVWEAGGYPSANTTNYVRDQGDGLYRRSVYTFWKRMATMPNMDAFDAPARDVACTRRQRTNTPLQALVTMNDTQWLEASRHLAERLLQEPADAGDDSRLARLGRLVLARDWQPAERSILQRQLAAFRATYRDQPAAAAQLLAVGASCPDPFLPAPEVAAWMLLASTAFNLDAVLNK